MKKIKIYLLILIGIFALGETNAQKEPMKFGKIEALDLTKTEYAIDPEAEAIVLTDFGKSWFEYSNVNERFVYKFKRHIRLKILKKEGYDWADGEVQFYEGSGGSKEEVLGLKGFTYNLVDGKLVKSKLEKGSIFEEKINKNWYRQKFSMPDVKEGSIIEYTYTITSDFLAEFRSWNFQDEIPVLLSEYRATIPEWYKYQQIQQGYAPFKTETSKKQEKFTIKYTSNNSSRGVPDRREYDMSSYSTVYRWTGENIPALKEEPYITSLENYFSRIEFMLSSVEYPNQIIDRYMGDYPSYNKQLLDGKSYGSQLKSAGFLKDDLERLKAQNEGPEALTIAIYNHIRSHMVWNGSYRMYITSTLRNAYKERKGSSSDINLLLVLMLKEAGLMVDPVILGTRNSYTIHPIYPLDSRFNYVIAQVTLGDKKIMLDATDKDRPFYLLPMRCLSGNGWVVSESRSGWTNLKNKEVLKQNTLISLKVEDGILMGDVSVQNQSLAAYEELKSYNDSEEDYKEEITTSVDWSVSDLTFKQDENKPINFSQNFKIENLEDITGSGILYLNPVIFSSLTDNPFKLEERVFPVEYPCSEISTYILNFKIPDGYIVEELPEGKLLRLPAKGGSFSYSINEVGGAINLTIQQKINKRVFTQNDYPYLREFYNQMVSKCAEQIVLKRKS